MPTNVEYWVQEAQIARERDQRFLKEFGEDAWRDKQAQEGAVAYAFSDKNALGIGKGELRWLSDVYFYTKAGQRSLYFFSRFGGRSQEREFDYDAYGLLLVVNKPFPAEEYEQLLAKSNLSFRKLTTYRLADLTENQIREYWGNVSFWHGSIISKE